MQEYPADALAQSVSTVAELLRARAQEQPGRLAYTFLADGETCEFQMSYAEADRRACAVAAAVLGAGGVPGTRAMLLLPPGLDYVTAFFGCLYAGVVAVPVYPPDPFRLERTLPRLLAIVRDAGAIVALTTSPLLGFLDELTRRAPELGALRWLAVDSMPDPAAAGGDVTAVDPDATAVLQYTSGSTSAPRGVILSHRNLLHNSGLIQHFFGTTSESRGLAWLPPYHDMGLIGGLIQPLYVGFPVTLMSPLHFLERPLRWLRALDRFRVTVSGGPNFAYDLCVRKSDPEQRARLDLSMWQVAFNGAEPIRPGTLQRFADAFAPSGFRTAAFLSCYGLAEATLIVSGAGGRSGPSGAAGKAGRDIRPAVQVDRDALQRHIVTRAASGAAASGAAVGLMSSGRGAPGQQIAIVDPATSVICPPEQVGEIWVSGPSVARGYWGKSEETRRTFRARISGRDDGPFLRTGDLGFLLDGELVVTGRLKGLIIIRGRNHYPQDIELTAERADPALRPGGTAAFLIDEDEGEDEADGRLVLVHEVRREHNEIDVAAVAARIRQAVAQEHGLQVHTVALIRAGGMPKTSSGKIQRWLCRARFLSAELPEIGRGEAAPRAPAEGEGELPAAGELLSASPEHRAAQLESYLRGQVAAVAGIAADDLDGEQPLLAVGLDSLAVLQLKQRVETDLAVSLPLGAVLAGASLRDVVAQLGGSFGPRAGGTTDTAGQVAEAAMPPAECVAPMSYGQRSLWFVQQMEPDSTAYVITAALRLPDSADRSALRRALDTLVSRHPMLRTTFPVRDGEPVQLVQPSGQAAYRECDAHELDEAALVRQLTSAARQPFDLESGPLLRLELYRRPGGDVLLVAMHHIVADFWSMTVLARELGHYYTAYRAGRDAALPPPAATYLDVVEWQRSVLADQALAGELARYWDEQVGDGLPPLALFPAEVTNSSAGVTDSAPGGSRSFSLPAELTRRLRARALTEGVTLYVLLLAAFQAMLHRLTGQDDLIVATPVAARTRPDFAGVVGFCMNPLMIRNFVPDGGSFRTLLSRTRDRVIGALEHQEYPMALLVERHRIARGRGAVYEALFTFNRSPEHGDDLAALVMLGPPGVRRSLGSLQVEHFPLPSQECSVPLDLAMAEVGGALHGLLRYRADLFDESAAARLAEQFVTVLETAAADPDRVDLRADAMASSLRSSHLHATSRRPVTPVMLLSSDFPTRIAFPFPMTSQQVWKLPLRGLNPLFSVFAG